MFRFRDRRISRVIIEYLKNNDRWIRVMHVCGTHQDTIVRYGLQDLLLKCNIEVRQGPGCPVCVTTSKEIKEAIKLGKSGKVIVSYGDMLRVPCSEGSLNDLRAKGGEVHAVYSVEDAVELAKKKRDKEIIFIAVGFETTAPTIAAAILSDPPENFSILCCNRLIPPAVETLLQLGEIKIDGFIEPGHVSTIIGTRPYLRISEKYKIPQVIAGFEPLDILMATLMIVRQLEEGRREVENEYIRAVREEGNQKALEKMREVFREADVKWRGFPLIPKSGLTLKEEFQEYDARKKFEDELEGIEDEEIKGCRCGEVLRGLIESRDCPLFGKACTPEHPVGPCMVSVEGSCNIEYRYGAKTSN